MIERRLRGNFQPNWDGKIIFEDESADELPYDLPLVVARRTQANSGYAPTTLNRRPIFDFSNATKIPSSCYTAWDIEVLYKKLSKSKRGLSREEFSGMLSREECQCALAASTSSDDIYPAWVQNLAWVDGLHVVS